MAFVVLLAVKGRRTELREARRRTHDLDRREGALTDREEGLLRERLDLERRDERLHAREERVQEREQLLVERERVLGVREGELRGDVERLDGTRRRVEEETRATGEALAEAERLVDERRSALEAVAGLDAEGARRHLLHAVDRELADVRARRIAEATARAEAEAEAQVRELIVTTLERQIVGTGVRTSVASIPLPDDELKGRVIGKDGRNVRAFEAATGCDVVVDETPGRILVSSFDPVRREVARRSMTRLVEDGRIQPARIEEIVAEEREGVSRSMEEQAEAALRDAGVGELHPELKVLLGRLAYRTSYGQNVLAHSVEVARIAGTLASELGLDPGPARRAGLLHDVGKAVDAAVEGPHHEVAGALLRRHGEAPEVAKAVEGHHEGAGPTSAYAVLVRIADAVSAARPGARREDQERFVQRLRELEEVALRFEGVEHAYAIQAGREVRVLVDADVVSDEHAPALAHDIARCVQEELLYPGEVRVTVIRETRVVDIAR